MNYIKKILCLFFIIIFQNIYADKITLLYTANINATYKNCQCGKNPLGGIDRLKTFLDEYRQNNKNAILVDGGNFFNSYPYPDLNTKIIDALDLLNFNLIAPGIHLFYEKRKLYEIFEKKFKENLITSNTNLGYNEFKDFKIGKKQFRFFYFISSENFKYQKKPKWLKFNNKIKDWNLSKNGVNILLFNGYLNSAKTFLYNHAGFDLDLVLLSTEQKKGSWKYKNTLIVGPGHDAEFVTIIEISENKNKTIFNIVHKPLNESIRADHEITKLFKDIDKVDISGDN